MKLLLSTLFAPSLLRLARLNSNTTDDDDSNDDDSNDDDGINDDIDINDENSEEP